MPPPVSRRDFVQTCAISALALASARVLRAADALGAAPAAGPASRRLRLDRGWLFGGPFKPGCAAPGFDDRKFQPVTVPHCVAKLSWAAWTPAQWDKVWVYRRHFRRPRGFAGMRVFLHFDAVMTGATPTLNGDELPRHLGGYLPFRYEITSLLNDGDNVLALAVDGRWSNVPPDGSPVGPWSVDFMEPAGITRPVWLEAVPPVFVSDVVAKPVNVLQPDRRIEVACTLDAAAATAAPVHVEVQLRDGDRVLARAAQTVPVGHAGVTEVRLTLTNLGDVALWDVDAPTLYDVVTTLSAAAAPVHDHRVRIGLREARFERDGFFLNGRRLQLFGLNRHELYPYVGFAMPARVQRHDAAVLRRELNCNVVRCSHYPQSDAFLDACDELGLLVWEEMPGWHYIGDTAWQDLAVRDVEAMVRRDRNRPSVILWGVRVNESANDPAFYRRTTAAMKALDDTRPASGAINGPMHSLKEWAEDVFAYNDYQHSGSGGDPELRPPLPGVPYLLTEAVGQIVGPGPGSTHKYRRASDPVVQRRQAIYHAMVHEQAARNPRYAGVIAWCAFDYGSLMNSYNGVKCPGVCDIFRIPKLGAAFYQSQLSPEVRPVIAPNFTWDFGPQSPRGPGAHVAIFSNCSRLEVFIAGRRHAELTADRAAYPHLKFPPFFVDLDLDGQGHPELRIDGFVGERRVLSKSYTSDPADERLALAADDPALVGDGTDATRVVLRIVDRFGENRPYAGGLVSFVLSGPGELVGDNPFWLSESGGVAAVWLRTRAGQPGTVELTATHATLGAQTIRIAVTAPPAGSTDVLEL